MSEIKYGFWGNSRENIFINVNGENIILDKMQLKEIIKDLIKLNQEQLY